MVSAVSSNSSLTMQLLSQTQQQTPQARFASADSDSSDGLSLDEYANFAPEFVSDVEDSFNSIDSDGDGSLTQTELQSFAENNGINGRPPPPPPPSDSADDTSTELTLLEQLAELSEEEQSSVYEFQTALLSLQESYL